MQALKVKLELLILIIVMCIAGLMIIQVFGETKMIIYKNVVIQLAYCAEGNNTVGTRSWISEVLGSVICNLFEMRFWDKYKQIS